MLIITRGANSTLIMTLTEKSTLSNPYYLMRLINDTTRQEKLFLMAADLSSYTYRYNKFTVTESGTELLTSGTVELRPTGFWTYEIYEQASSSNLTLNATGAMVEQGKVKVVGTDTIYTEHPITLSYKSYGVGA